MIINKIKRKILKLMCLFLVGLIFTTELVNIYPQTVTAQTPQACAQITNPLTPDEERYARSAWQYFVNNYQENTGFANSANNYPSGTLWDMGNYLMALNAARWLNFIPQEDFDSRLGKFLTSLGQLRLFEDSLPNKVYQAATGELVDYNNNSVERGIGWSALDVGRILAAFHVLRTCHPQYNEWLQSIIQGWAVERSIQDGQMLGAAVLQDGETLLVQEGRLGYEEYAARGYELWDYQVPVSLSFEPFKFVQIYDIPIPVDTREYETTNANNYVVSESYILEGIEFGFEGEIAEYAARVLEVQKRRYEQTGQLTAVSEDNINQPPYFLYNTVYSNGKNWATITEKNEDYPQFRTISCKAVFGWRFLYPDNEYARTVYEQVKERCVTPDGIIAGIYEENNQLNDVLTGNTNGLMMEILYYKARGNKPLIGYDSVSVSTGKPVGKNYTAPILTANQTETSSPPTTNQTPTSTTTNQTPTSTTTNQTPTAMVIEPIEKVGDLGKLTCPIPTRKLSVLEKRHSEAAWQYFEANYETNTGLVNDRADFKGVTLWGIGDYLAALHAARSLEIITSEKFDQRIRKLLAALQRMFLFAGQLPHRGYDSQTLQPIDYGGNPTTEGTGWSGLDIARVMASLYNLKTCYPNYHQVIDEIVLQWSYSQLVREGRIFSAEVDKDDNGRILTNLISENRFGYEEYAARALQLWGFEVNKAAVSKEYQAKVIDKVTVPIYRENEQQNPYLVSNPFLHYGLEFGFDPQMRQLVEPIFKVQQERYRETGILTGAATTLINRSPYIIHSAIAGWGKVWPTQSADEKSIPEQRIVSTAVAFGFYALFPESEYSRLLWESTSDLYNPNLGYYEGFYEKNGKREPSFSSTTNAIVLQSLLFHLTKNQPLIRPEIDNNSLWWKQVKQGDVGRSLPEKAQQTARFMNNSQQGSYWVSDDNYVDLNIVGVLSLEQTPPPAINIPQTSAENNNSEDLPANSTNIEQKKTTNLELPASVSNNNNQTILREDDLKAAQIAWKYLERNYNHQTGLINAVENYPWTTLWDQGSAILGIHAAYQLGIINKTNFENKLNRLLVTLENLPLSSTGLLNKAYSTKTAQMRSLGNQPDPQGLSGWSVLDTARFLLSLHVLKIHYPELANRINNIVKEWNTSRLINDGWLQGGKITAQGKLVTFQEGRLGYEQYAALSLKLWNLTASKALFSPPTETINIEGINLQIDRRNWHNSNASNYLTNDPYLLWGLELGWNDEIKPQVTNLLKVQETRFKNTQILTAVNEDSLDRKPYFLYYSIYADGEFWSSIDVNRKSYPQLRFLSTKAAFAWNNLMPNNFYSQKLRDKVQNLADANLGYFAGRYENNKLGINKVLNVNTNGIILESLLYKARNNLPLALY